MSLFSRNKSESKASKIYASKIKNDWDAGFKAGYPLWEKGEAERKAGNYEKAIAFYDRAKKSGYIAPALYKSYAMTYRKMKDTDSEIKILEEGIMRMQSSEGNFKTGIQNLKEQLAKAKTRL